MPTLAPASSLLSRAEPVPPSAEPSAPVVVLFLDHTAAWSGGEIALLRLLEALDPQRVRPLVLLAADGPLRPRLEELGVETHLLPLGEHVRELRKDGLGWAALRQGWALFAVFWYAVRVAWFARRHGVQIMHTNSLKSDIYGGLAGLLARVPVVWHVRDHINPAYLPQAAVTIFRHLARWVPAFVVTNSQSTLGELQLKREHHTAIVPSGLRLRSGVVHDGLTRTEMTPETPPALTEVPERPWHWPVRLGLVGRIARWKGQHIFLQAAAAVQKAGHDAEFWIVGAPLFGEEAYEAELRQLVVTLGLQERVRFFGFQANVQEVYRQLDVLVHASISAEPFGQVVIEGMAEGLPVVATDGGGVREIINHRKNGLLVPMGDAVAMAAALQEVLADPAAARQMGVAGFHWVRRHFTSEQSARKIERVYRTILQQRGLKS